MKKNLKQTACSVLFALFVLASPIAVSACDDDHASAGHKGVTMVSSNGTVSSSGVSSDVPATTGPESLEYMRKRAVVPGSRGYEGGVPPEGLPQAVPGSEGLMIGEPGVSEGYSEGNSGAGGSDGGAQGIAPPMMRPEPVPACPHQDMVGKKMSDSFLKSIKAPVRVLYPGTPVTMDYNPNRINIILEEGTDIITEVRCG